MSSLRAFLLLGAILVGMANPARAELDSRLLLLSSQFADPIAWLNVEGRPFWVGGVEPKYDRERSLHMIELVPGDLVRVIVPRGEALLVQGDPLLMQSLQWWSSNGSGLWATPSVLSIAQPDQVLLPFTMWGTRLVEIALAQGACCPMRIALFVSRRDRGVGIRFERQAIALEARKRTLILGLQPQGGPLHEINPNRPLQVEVDGPHRYLLEHRLFYPKDVSIRRWSYRVQLRAGEHESESEFVGVPEVRDISIVSGRTRVVGRLERSYIDVEDGRHTLTIRTDAPLIARLLGPFDEHRAALVGPTNATTEGSAWLDDSETIDRAATADPRSNAHQRALLRIARDNRRLDSGLLATGRAMAEARAIPNLTPIRRFAEMLAISQVGYRELLATRSAVPHDDEARSYRYTTPRLRSPGDDRDRYVIADQHVAALRRRLVPGRFLPLPHRDDEELIYALPRRSAASRFRLALQPASEQNDGCRLLVSLGPDRTVLLRTGSTAADELRDVGAPEVATALQAASRDIEGEVPGLGWSSATSSVELDLPESAEEVRVRSENCGERRIALAYAAGRTDSMNEAEYRAAVKALGGSEAAARLFSAALEHLDELFDGSGPLAEAVGRAGGDDAWQRAAAARLLNHWLPSLRVLRVRTMNYARGIESAPAAPTPFEITAADRAEAEGLERDGNWLAAYEAWARIAAASPGETAGRARMRAVDALLRAGDSSLAAAMLRSDFIHGGDASLHTLAFERLSALYHQQGNEIALEAVLATRAVETTGAAQAEALARLSELALEQGDGALALTLDLVVPPGNADSERRAEASYLNEWWMTFDETLVAMTPAAADRWRGYRAQQAGDGSSARRHWRAAGEAGSAPLHALEEALSIRSDLFSWYSDERRLALRRWAAWRTAVPGRRVWKPAEELAISGQGGEFLRSPSLGLNSRWLRSTPASPLKIRVVGPTRLRVDARPLVDGGSPKRIPGWLVLRSQEHQWRSPMTRGPLSNELLRLGKGPEKVGLQSRSQLELGAGVHEIEIFDPSGALLLRLFEERPQLALAILPDLGPNALDWIAGTSPPAANSTIECTGFGIFELCSKPLIVWPSFRPSSHAVSEWKAAFDSDRPLAARPTGEGSAWPQLLPAAEVLSPHTAASEAGLIPSLIEATRILWSIEEQGHEPNRGIARIGELADAHRTNPLMQRLHVRAMSNFRWQRVSSILQSAGLRLVPRRVGAPLSPASRKKWPLLGRTCQASERLREHEDLVVSLENLAPARIVVELENCNPLFEEPKPVMALLEADGAEPEEILLDAQERKVERVLSVDRGHHAITVSALAVSGGQTIGVRVFEDGLPLLRPLERAYHVARTGAPLIVAISGPARIRIDELGTDSPRTSYRSTPAGVTRLELLSSDAPETLYRVTQAVPAEDVAPREVVFAPEPPPPHTPPRYASLAGELPVPENLAPEVLTPGLEDGTWTWSSRYLDRASLDEEEDTGKRERIAELRGTHRFFHETRGLFTRSDVFLRVRQDGGPLLGLRGESVWPSPGIWRGLELRAKATSLLQVPTGGPNRLEALLGGEVEAALPHAINAKTLHRPSLALFGRWLSLRDRSGYPRENLDRDLFTPYKADHRFGMSLADALLYRPRRDVQVQLDGELLSNEDFDLSSPDRSTLQISASYLIGNIQLNAGYRWRHYFKDDKRKAGFERHDILASIQIERWLPLSRRWEAKLSLRHDVSRQATSFGLVISQHRGRDRGFRDFAPRSVRFRSERNLSRRRAMNRIEAVSR